MSLEWLVRNEFSKQYEIAYPDKNQRRPYWLADQISIDVRLDELKSAIPISPLSNPDDTDDAGPVERWYGITNDFYFFITYHHALDSAIISCRKGLPDQDAHLWSILNRLLELPALFLQRITWIRSHTTTATWAVSYRESCGMVCEVYRSENEIEALDLISFFKSLNASRNYFLTSPEDLGRNWIISETKPDAAETVVARYTLRQSSESVARQMSLESDSVFQVVEESSNRKGLAFLRGVATPKIEWPHLPKSGFLQGRAATLADIESGNAAFVLNKNPRSIPIAIPQYAWHVDHQSGQRTPVIITQAEQTAELKAVGYRPIGAASFGVATFAEFILLGTDDWYS